MSYDQYFDQGFEADLVRSLDFTLAFDQSESTPDFYRDLLSSPVPFESGDSNDSMSSLASRASFNANALPFVPHPDRSDDNLVSEMVRYSSAFSSWDFCSVCIQHSCLYNVCFS
jgi:hypothetical protein